MDARRYFESKCWESTLYKYVWDAAKITHRRKFIFLNTYINEEERLINYYQDFQERMIEKQTKPTIKLKEVNNKMSNRGNTKKSMEIIMEYKVNFVKMINKLGIFLGRFIKGIKKNTNCKYK